MASVLDNFANNCTGRVVSGGLTNTNNPVVFQVGPTDLTGFVAPGTITAWDDATYGQNPSADPQMEILSVTSYVPGVGGGNGTVTAYRGAENTTNVSHSASTPKVAALLTAGIIEALAGAVDTLQSAAAPVADSLKTDFPHSAANGVYSLGYNPVAAHAASWRFM